MHISTIKHGLKATKKLSEGEAGSFFKRWILRILGMHFSILFVLNIHVKKFTFKREQVLLYLLLQLGKHCTDVALEI